MIFKETIMRHKKIKTGNEKGVLLHQENSPAHKSVVGKAAVLHCSFELQLG